MNLHQQLIKYAKDYKDGVKYNYSSPKEQLIDVKSRIRINRIIKIIKKSKIELSGWGPAYQYRIFKFDKFITNHDQWWYQGNILNIHWRSSWDLYDIVREKYDKKNSRII